MIKVGNLLKVVKGNRFVGDVVVVTRVDAENGIFIVLDKEEGRKLAFQLEEADNFIKFYNIKEVMEEEGILKSHYDAQGHTTLHSSGDPTILEEFFKTI